MQEVILFIWLQEQHSLFKNNNMKLYPGERVITKSQLNKFNKVLKYGGNEKLNYELIRHKTKDSRLMYRLSLTTLIINTLILIGLLILVFL